MANTELPDFVYTQSYLKKAGVRFKVNVVDTTVKRGFSLNFYLAALCFIALCCLPGVFFFMGALYLPVILLFLAYLAYYAGRYLRFMRLRRRLRTEEMPILAESYAVVLLDESVSQLPKPLQLCAKLKSAVIYKETGSLKPRFFLGPSFYRTNFDFFKPDVKAQVFTDKKHERFYSVDDESAVQTASAKARLTALNLGSSLSSGAEKQALPQQGTGSAQKSAQVDGRAHSAD